jgi:hypothetical protein
MAEVVLLLDVMGAVAACVKLPDPAVTAILPPDVNPVLAARLIVVAASVTAPPTVIGAVANCTLLVVRLRLPLMPVPLIPFSVVVPVPANCVRFPAILTVLWNVTVAAESMVSPVRAVVAPTAPSVRLPAPSVVVSVLAPLIALALTDPPAVLKEVFPASVTAPRATLSAEVVTLPLSVTLPLDEPSCSVRDPVPELDADDPQRDLLLTNRASMLLDAANLYTQLPDSAKAISLLSTACEIHQQRLAEQPDSVERQLSVVRMQCAMATLLKNLQDSAAAVKLAQQTLLSARQITLTNPLLQPELMRLQDELQAIIDSQNTATAPPNSNAAATGAQQ